MAKDSFILYKDQAELFESLSNEDAGKLIKAIFNYATTGETQKLDGVLKIAFIPIKQQLDRNELKWIEVKNKRSQAGKLGMEKRWKKDLQSQSFITNDNKAYQTITKITVNDNVNVNVNDNNKENIKRKKFIAPTLEEIQKYIDEKNLRVSAKAFYDYFEEGGWIDSKGNKVKNWKQKLLTWERYSIVEKKDIKEYQKADLGNLEKLYEN